MQKGPSSSAQFVLIDWTVRPSWLIEDGWRLGFLVGQLALLLHPRFEVDASSTRLLGSCCTFASRSRMAAVFHRLSKAKTKVLEHVETSKVSRKLSADCQAQKRTVTRATFMSSISNDNPRDRNVWHDTIPVTVQPRTIQKNRPIIRCLMARRDLMRPGSRNERFANAAGTTGQLLLVVLVTRRTKQLLDVFHDQFDGHVILGSARNDNVGVLLRLKGRGTSLLSVQRLGLRHLPEGKNLHKRASPKLDIDAECVLIHVHVRECLGRLKTKKVRPGYVFGSIQGPTSSSQPCIRVRIHEKLHIEHFTNLFEVEDQNTFDQ